MIQIRYLRSSDSVNLVYLGNPLDSSDEGIVKQIKSCSRDN
jgi:hypothetical protein